jgi:2'-5' RNA ligase|tara:strand:- start:695 stop:1246 length:552 start_codon:yes stop_codon:yes gene_type:complete
MAYIFDSSNIINKRNPLSYSIWLMPTGSMKQKLKQVINELSINYGGPTFGPHVTLISSFLGNEEELLQRTEKLASKITPFGLKLRAIKYLNEFFRSFFLDVELTNDLKQARSAGLELFTCNENEYRPHMSLAYGDFTVSQKEKMKKSLSQLPKEFIVNNFFLAHNNENDLRWRVIRGFLLNAK